jgi:hypothetical protein
MAGPPPVVFPAHLRVLGVGSWLRSGPSAGRSNPGAGAGRLPSAYPAQEGGGVVQTTRHSLLAC